jgi:hypothetical protein
MQHEKLGNQCLISLTRPASTIQAVRRAGGRVIGEASDHLHSQRSESDLAFGHLRWELRCQSRPPRNVE